MHNSGRNSAHDRPAVPSSIRILGAGVAGLTTAIRLAQAGVSVEVLERRADSGLGNGFRCDAIENWTSPEDFASQLQRWSIDADDFLHRPESIQVCTDDRRCCAVKSGDRPLLYLVQRGNGGATLEGSLKRQALALGVAIRYGAIEAVDRVDVRATGCARRGLFLDVGITFRTRRPDGVVILFDQRVAPDALAYLAVAQGVGTLAVLLTRRMRFARTLLARAVDAFQRLAPFEMQDIQLTAGFGGSLRSPVHDDTLVVGEAAGFLDYLWGFGIRQAMLSGDLAAQAILRGGGYTQLVAQEIAPLVDCSLINRRLFQFAGNRIHRALVRYVETRADPGELLRRAYRSSGLRGRFAAWARRSMAQSA